MKIGILTYHFSNNYGALLQAYGLRQWLLQQGFEAEFINYQPEYLKEGGKIKLNTLFSKATLTIIYLKFVNLREKYFGNKQKEKYFENFRKEFLGLHSSTIYKDKNSLEKANLDFDILIAGSDQIWNPSGQYGLDSVYFLDFKTANLNIKKISYAPSFGKSTLDKKYTKKIGNMISKLNFISIREKSGYDIIEKLTTIKSTLVPDPTILISNYEKLFNPYQVKENKFIFCYYLRSRDTIGETAEYLSSKEKLAIYTPHNPHRRWKEIGETIYPGPREWLYMLNNSKFVVTNSFHGTMLSILLNKPFIVTGIGSGEKSKYNERTKNILSQCGLEERFVNKFDIALIDYLKNKSINWEKVNDKINILKNDAKNYLYHAIIGK